MRTLLFLMLFVCTGNLLAQNNCAISGVVTDKSGQGIAYAQVAVFNTTSGTSTDSLGRFCIKNLNAGRYTLAVLAVGYSSINTSVQVPGKNNKIVLQSQDADLSEVVVTGTMKEMSKDDSPINIDIITPKLFQKTATANLFEATSLVNGVKPQINCNVCNTGDIHINGMEGPYTLILIDGMPIVSGLSSVYGLMGIPASMIERLEIAKGPAGALYGSEAMGGTINLISKSPSRAPKLYADYYTTSYLENNLDLSARLKLGKKTDWLIGANTYWYDHKVDKNADGFTDVTLQKRFSFFNKVAFTRKDHKEFTMAGRYVGEDRWGGEMNWNKNFRGGDSIYGESIYAHRGEFIGKYQWPTREKIYTQVSYNIHDQNSVYGKVTFLARQSTAFVQTYWTKQINTRNDFLGGITYKNLWYDDNTGATALPGGGNAADLSNTLGAFVQNETTLDSLSKHKILLGCRADYNDVYKLIPSPRIAYKWTPNYKFTTRLNLATGFRIVNVFTEDHAALTGAREVVFEEKIRPENSYNGSLNVVWKNRVSPYYLITWDASVFYYHFTNKIYANYDLDPNKVIYRNLNGYAYSRGWALNATIGGAGKWKLNLGVTYSDVKNFSKDSSGTLQGSRQLHAPLWSGIGILSYDAGKGLKADVTANWYGPQRLPILPNDYRPEYSPLFCLLNFQLSKTFKSRFEVYAGVKNLLNFLPLDPIMRPQDPFDKKANDVSTNPNGYTFDPSYSYAPMQGIRCYAGFRVSIQ